MTCDSAHPAATRRLPALPAEQSPARTPCPVPQWTRRRPPKRKSDHQREAWFTSIRQLSAPARMCACHHVRTGRTLVRGLGRGAGGRASERGSSRQDDRAQRERHADRARVGLGGTLPAVRKGQSRPSRGRGRDRCSPWSDQPTIHVRRRVARAVSLTAVTDPTVTATAPAPGN